MTFLQLRDSKCTFSVHIIHAKREKKNIIRHSLLAFISVKTHHNAEMKCLSVVDDSLSVNFRVLPQQAPMNILWWGAGLGMAPLSWMRAGSKVTPST